VQHVPHYLWKTWVTRQSWRFKCSGIWHCVLEWVLSSVSKDCSAFVFRVKQPRPLYPNTMIFGKEGKHSSQDTASHYRTLESSALPLWEPKVSHGSSAAFHDYEPEVRKSLSKWMSHNQCNHKKWSRSFCGWIEVLQTRFINNKHQPDRQYSRRTQRNSERVVSSVLTSQR